jgi:hypothetical protein
LSQQLTKCSQDLAEGTAGADCGREVPVFGSGSGKALIDLIEDRSRTAYELKVSSNNPRHEFYKDIFTVLAYNEENPGGEINRLKFMTPRTGAEKLIRDRLAQKTLLLATKLGLEVEIVPLRVP